MTKPYGLLSDLHAHNWSQFSQVDADGVNTRLRIILDELLRAAQALKAAGGTTLRVAGDLFHVRGNIAPSVLNPTFATFKAIADMGIDIEIIPGNHDLEGVHADELGNAMQQLDLIDGVEVITKPTVCEDGTVMLPWYDSLADLRKEALKLKDANADLIVHAPLNGVIRGLPDHGLDPVDVSKWGFKRVWTGHYHNHTAPMPNVISIGATTHQTWSDPGTLAGFVLVYPDRYEHFETQAPKFVNYDGEDLIDANRYAGNYVRMRMQDVDEAILIARKEQMRSLGAKGIVDHSSKKRDATRGIAVAQNLTLEESVSKFIEDELDVGTLSKQRISQDALRVLTEARTVGAE